MDTLHRTGGPVPSRPARLARAERAHSDNRPAGAFDATDYLDLSATGDGVTYRSATFSLYNNFDGTGN